MVEKKLLILMKKNCKLLYLLVTFLHILSPMNLFIFTDFLSCLLRVEQVQEKRVKKVSDYNLDPSKAVGNGTIASSSNSSSPKSYLANGGCPDISNSYLSNELLFPPEGIPSLRLPVVVVHNPLFGLA